MNNIVNELVSGDTGSAIQSPVVDSMTGAAVNLTGASVKLKWKDLSGVLQSVDATVIDAPNGIIQYYFLANEIFAPQMNIEVEVTDSGGLINTSLELINIPVRQKLA